MNLALVSGNETYSYPAIMNVTNQTQLNQTSDTEYSALSFQLVIFSNVTLIVLPFIIVFGTFGNLLTFYVMRTGSLKDVSVCFYISILAIVDTGKSSCFTYTSECQY